jgi:signal transduction histidine kinase
VVLTLAGVHPELVAGGPDQTAPLSSGVPLTLGLEQIGGIDVALRPGQRRLSARDHAALTASVGPLAGAVVAVRLTNDLRRSRTELVTAREEERQMLRSQLHDEFGPTMAGLRHRVNAARRDLELGAGTVEEHLVEADGLVAGLLSDLRELARGLRPPELDELGLIGAVRRFAGGLSPVPSVASSVERRLPAAVEVAAYRIVIEAMLNAERHARAGRISVHLSTPADRLLLEVVDDGIGADPDAPAGVGLVGMRQRAAELGGSLNLLPSADGGTRVRCELPIVAGEI